ncbi:MAG: hypothetical protein ACREQO_26000, partial [Candidatus Binatia bacterium]
GPCVTVFGSARFTEEHLYYSWARQCGAKLAAAGFTIMTGGADRASWRRPIAAPRKPAAVRLVATFNCRRTAAE